MNNKVNETTINFAVYEGASRYIGIASVTLPTLANVTTNVSGAGIPGEYESSVIGQTQPMTLSMQFPTMSVTASKFIEQRDYKLELRPVNQDRDLGGKPTTSSLKHLFTCQPKSFNAGTIKPNSTNDASVEFSVTRWATFIDGVKTLEVDKLNFIYEVNGVDYMAPVRKGLGM